MSDVPDGPPGRADGPPGRADGEVECPDGEVERADGTAGSLGDEVETHRVIEGRRWRVSDPRIPEELRQALVDELMSARRAVRSAKRAEESARADAERAARDRVHDAKVALGERGVAWWEDDVPADEVDDRIRRAAGAIGRAAELGSVPAHEGEDLVGAVAAITSTPTEQVTEVLGGAAAARAGGDATDARRGGAGD